MSYYLTDPPTQNAYSIYFGTKFDDREAIAIPTGWRQFWANSPPKYAPDASAFSVDIIRGNERTAALVRRGAAVPDGVSLDNKKPVDGRSTNFTRQFPLSEDESPILASRLLWRQPGESPYEQRSRIERMRAIAGSIYSEQTARALRLNNLLAAQAMQTGKQAYILGDTTDIIDYKRTSGNTIACANAWDTVSGTPLADLYSGCIQAEQQGHSRPTMAIFDGATSNAFFNEAALQALADIRGFTFIRAGGNMQPPADMARFASENAFVYMGQITLPQGYKLEIFVDTSTYVNAAGTVTPYMTANTAVLCNPSVRFDLLIGPPEVMPMTSTEQAIYNELMGISSELISVPSSNNRLVPPSSIYHDAYMAPNRKSIQCRTQSAFVYAPVHTDSIVTLTGCAT